MALQDAGSSARIAGWTIPDEPRERHTSLGPPGRSDPPLPRGRRVSPARSPARRRRWTGCSRSPVRATSRAPSRRCPWPPSTLAWAWTRVTWSGARVCSPTRSSSASSRPAWRATSSERSSGRSRTAACRGSASRRRSSSPRTGAGRAGSTGTGPSSCARRACWCARRTVSRWRSCWPPRRPCSRTSSSKHSSNGTARERCCRSLATGRPGSWSASARPCSRASPTTMPRPSRPAAAPPRAWDATTPALAAAARSTSAAARPVTSSACATPPTSRASPAPSCASTSRSTSTRSGPARCARTSWRGSIRGGSIPRSTASSSTSSSATRSGTPCTSSSTRWERTAATRTTCATPPTAQSAPGRSRRRGASSRGSFLQRRVVGFYQRLLRDGAAESQALDLIEAEARKSIDSGSVDVAFDLLWSAWPCLGILAARGAAPLAHPLDRETLLEHLGLARDRLGLPALDPTEGLEGPLGRRGVRPLRRAAARPPPRARRAACGARRSTARAPPDDGTERSSPDTEAELARLRQELADLHGRLDQRHAAVPSRPPALPGRRSRRHLPRTLASRR